MDRCKFEKEGKCTNPCASTDFCPTIYTEENYKECDWYCAPLSEEEMNDLKYCLHNASSHKEDIEVLGERALEYIEQLEAKNSELLATCDTLREEKAKIQRDSADFAFRAGQTLAHSQEQTKRKYIQQTLQEVYDEVSDYSVAASVCSLKRFILGLAKKAEVVIEE